jgi:hypothetical protein
VYELYLCLFCLLLEKLRTAFNSYYRKMITLTAEEKVNPDRIWKMWELPRGAKVQVHYVRQEVGKPDTE